MSCCAPAIAPSNEPRYVGHPALLAQVGHWEPLCPGIRSIVEDALGTGDMDAVCAQGMVPAYPLVAAAQVALQCLESTWLERERHRLVTTGPLLVRWGLVPARPALTPAQQQTLDQARADLKRLVDTPEPPAAPLLYSATLLGTPWA